MGAPRNIVGKISQKEDISGGLLMGKNWAKALEPIDIMPSKTNGPYAFKPKLGWCIVGPKIVPAGRKCAAIG